MDEYGTFCLKLEDAKRITDRLREHGSVVFPLTGDSHGCMIVLMAERVLQMGVMPFGGDPDGRIYVGVYGRGCSHFAPQRTHATYFAEKLKLDTTDAIVLMQFWSLMWDK